ncbi:hypothetical protein QTI66_13055 [Variovorax sp. J22R133]|uniref:hypothetical protein n=1 Tax=Variovorax brevis TaxID=3053503 RepID=UPI00257761BC|nr:hypothetical protein [Variovorax sp. J22R133]MDM0113080.1 hypothetical protein [Variovorax sp. J22R133]
MTNDLNDKAPNRARIVVAGLAAALLALTACDPKPTSPPQPKAEAASSGNMIALARVRGLQ